MVKTISRSFRFSFKFTWSAKKVVKKLEENKDISVPAAKTAFAINKNKGVLVLALETASAFKKKNIGSRITLTNNEKKIL